MRLIFSLLFFVISLSSSIFGVRLLVYNATDTVMPVAWLSGKYASSTVTIDIDHKKHAAMLNPKKLYEIISDQEAPDSWITHFTPQEEGVAVVRQHRTMSAIGIIDHDEKAVIVRKADAQSFNTYLLEGVFEQEPVLVVDTQEKK